MLTAVERRLPIVYVVLNNATLQIEREQMLKFYGRHSLTDYVRDETARRTILISWPGPSHGRAAA